MPISLTGYLIVDLFVLFIILLLPIPTTPYLVFLVLTVPILEFGAIYLLASNLMVTSLYIIGSNFKRIPFNKFFKIDSITNSNSWILRLKAWYGKALVFSDTKLRNITPWQIIVIRTIGVHPIIVSFGIGLIKGSLFNNILANSICSIIDIIFYWILIGSGKILIERFFPNLDIENIINNDLFAILSISLIVFYSFFFIWKWLKSKQ